MYIRCWESADDDDDKEPPSVDEILAHLKYGVPIGRLMVDNSMKMIAKDETKSENERVTACIRMANNLGTNIGWQELLFISYIIKETNAILDMSHLVEIEKSYKNRLKLIDSITVDGENSKDQVFLLLLASILNVCFHDHLSKFQRDEKCIETSQQIRIRICQLIIVKIRFILCADIWMNADWSITFAEKSIMVDNRIYILCLLTLLLVDYRIEMSDDDMTLLANRFSEITRILPNEKRIGKLADRINQIERIRSLSAIE